jgi:hypothetical protein
MEYDMRKLKTRLGLVSQRIFHILSIALLTHPITWNILWLATILDGWKRSTKERATFISVIAGGLIERLSRTYGTEASIKLSNYLDIMSVVFLSLAYLVQWYLLTEVTMWLYLEQTERHWLALAPLVLPLVLLPLDVYYSLTHRNHPDWQPKPDHTEYVDL